MSNVINNPRRTLACAAFLLCLPLVAGGNDPTIRPSARVQQAAADHAAPKGGQIEGFTEPYADIDMAASEMGTLASVAVRDGDIVQAGDLLANLDDAVLQASLEVARAGMNAEGELKNATTQLQLKKVELEKITRLFGRNHASQQELDRVSGEVRIAEARIQSVREDLEVRRLEFARIEAQLRQRQIRSTIDGVVVEVRKDHGEFVSPSDPVVARVVQLDPLLVNFSVPVARRNELQEGASVPLSIGDLAASADGVIEYISPTADASSGTFRVKVRLANPDSRWHGGEKTVLNIDVGTRARTKPKQIAKRSR